jgi:choline dehydrogenase
VGRSRRRLAITLKCASVEKFDFIIVGAGSAGCVLAEQLSASGRDRVLVLEAGGADRSFWIRTPIGYGRTFASAAVNWKYQTQPNPALGGRTMYWPRGRVVGGSSSINALVYCRGMPADFDDWRALGNIGWGWDEVRPYFEKNERRVDPGGRALTDGALDVKDVRPFLHATRETWYEVARELALPLSEDFNGPHPEGLGCYQITVRNGRRWSAADAFLRPALRRPTVRLETEAWVSRIRMQGRSAIGVDYLRGGKLHRVDAAREIILCGGAVNSPQLLQLSGVGPARLLSKFGIAVVHENPAVGGNLQDHLGVSYYYEATQKTLNNELHSPLGKFLAGVRYLATRGGPLGLSVNQFGGFVRARPDGTRPDQQLYFSPVSYGSGDANRKRIEVDPFAGFLVCFQPSRPTSRGRIDIASADYHEAPDIAPNYLGTEEDIADVLHGGRLMQRIMRTRAMRALTRKASGPDVMKMDDAELLADFRARSATVYHPVSTCRMGPNPGNSVVDSQLRVHGLERLRVVDASVFPTVTSGNTNAPTLMVARRAADLILAGKG